MPHALIVVRDEEALRQLEEAARGHAFSVSLARSAEAGLSQMETRFPDLLFLDRSFEGLAREALLDQVCRSEGGTAVLVGPGELGKQKPDSRAEDPWASVSDLADPVEAERVQAILEGVASSVAELQGEEAPEECPDAGPIRNLMGSSPKMRRLRHLVSRVAPSRASVLVSGESGSGKERVARTIHDLSPRKGGPFVAVNCGAISATLMESQIFGHEKGSFSGASGRHRGLFEQSHGGTLLLDEITEMPLELQVKLLRVLETGSVVRLGAESPITVDVRILATTNRPPLVAVAEGKLRADLFYRLRILEVEVPPLRARLEDLPHLARAVLEEIGEREGQVKSIGPEVMMMLQAYDWPGNIRELRNTLYTAFLMSEGPELEAAWVSEEILASAPAEQPPGGPAIRIPVETSIREAERRLILMTLDHMEGRKDRTAEALGVSLKTLYNRLHEYGYMGGNGASVEA
jgi:two-component system, NtrC family, response regulator AtoC